MKKKFVMSPDGHMYGQYADGRAYGRYVDLDGNEVERTPESHPYSYDFHVVYRNRKADLSQKPHIHIIYSDRLYEWDYNLYQNLIKIHFERGGDNFDNRPPDKIEAFLSDYIGKKIKLIAMMKGCNQASGYPLWTFHYCHHE